MFVNRGKRLHDLYHGELVLKFYGPGELDIGRTIHPIFSFEQT